LRTFPAELEEMVRHEILGGCNHGFLLLYMWVVALSLISAADAASCSDYFSNSDCTGEEGCSWEEGMLYGGTCSGTQTTQQPQKTHGSASSGEDFATLCTCSDYNSDKDDIATVNLCESSGDGTGCAWEAGLVYGGICRGSCVVALAPGEDLAGPTAEECNKFGAWSTVSVSAAINHFPFLWALLYLTL